MKSLICKSCGAALKTDGQHETVVCEYCKTEHLITASSKPTPTTTGESDSAKPCGKGKKERISGNRTRRIVMMAMFTALAYAAMLLIHIKVGFLTMDVKDALITLCGLFFGPVSALLISVVVPLLELVTMSTTGVYGLIMNILGSVTFSVTVSLFYKWKRSLWGAVTGLFSGALLMVAVMMLANLFITPYYMGTTMETVRGMIPTLLLPFNLLKGLINVGAVLLLYKPLSRILRRLGVTSHRPKAIAVGKHSADPNAQSFSQKEENAYRSGAKSKSAITGIVVTSVAILLIAASVVLIFTVLGGKFTFGMT